MDFNAILMGTFSTLTGGIVHDVTTVMVAVITCGVMMLGLVIVKDVLLDKYEVRSREKNYDKAVSEAKWHKQGMDSADPVTRDISRVKYNQAINKAAKN
jgi:hypothetical protein